MSRFAINALRPLTSEYDSLYTRLHFTALSNDQLVDLVRDLRNFLNHFSQTKKYTAKTPYGDIKFACTDYEINLAVFGGTESKFVSASLNELRLSDAQRERLFGIDESFRKQAQSIDTIINIRIKRFAVPQKIATNYFSADEFDRLIVQAEADFNDNAEIPDTLVKRIDQALSDDAMLLIVNVLENHRYFIQQLKVADHALYHVLGFLELHQQ